MQVLDRRDLQQMLVAFPQLLQRVFGLVGPKGIDPNFTFLAFFAWVGVREEEGEGVCV
jgi:hypothetical protein